MNSDLLPSIFEFKVKILHQINVQEWLPHSKNVRLVWAACGYTPVHRKESANVPYYKKGLANFFPNSICLRSVKIHFRFTQQKIILLTDFENCASHHK